MITFFCTFLYLFMHIFYFLKVGVSEKHFWVLLLKFNTIVYSAISWFFKS